LRVVVLASVATSVAAVGVASVGLQAAGPQRTSSAPRTPGAAPTAPAAMISASRAVLDRYCVTCHNKQLRTAGLTLDTMSLDRVGEAAPAWEKVVRKLRTGTMPPVGRPRPDRSTYDGLASWLETALDRHSASAPNPGRPSIHRLNRAEYANVIRDLLGLEIDAGALLPADDTAYGFDNNADVLTLSPLLLERYMSAARRISRLALGDPTLRPSVESYAVSRYLVQDDRASEDLPFGTRGGIAVRHGFPLDGQYVISVHLQRRRSREPQELELRVDGVRVGTFTIGSDSGAQRSQEPADAPAVDPRLEARVTVTAGQHLVGAALVQRMSAPEGTAPSQLPVGNISFAGRRGAETSIERIDIDGPYDSRTPADSPSRQKILVCRPSAEGNDEACARRVLSTLARRAYRRNITDRDLGRLLAFYTAEKAMGGFDAGIRSALERILVDPQFLFRIERDPPTVSPGTPYRVTDVELASRLSFFLWSSMPDEELLDLAVRGTLHQPPILERQVRRMLADARSSALVSNFAMQWLHVRNVPALAPDVNAFPAFDDNLRQAFLRETELFLESQLREDRSVAELLTANYTFVNERLARHYGLPHVYGSHFRRVTYPDGRRAGLLGHGSILTVTSYATRTSPVVRGKWLLENILGAPPPAPPPNVPNLPERGVDGKAASVRERLEQHRSNPVCASCHAQMDPLGFALENFDAIGRWRTVGEGDSSIDATGALPDGARFEGPEELRTLLLARRENFVTTVVEKLLTYGLGRGVEYYDMPAIRKIRRDAAASDFRWSSLIAGVVKSAPFQMRRAAD
jgi:mono/diheme cytochrome c family protein